MFRDRFGRLTLLVALLGASVPHLLGAQAPILPSTPQLQEVVRLAQEGYGDSARATMARILVRLQPGDAGFPEALFTAATVARTGDEMRANFSKIVLDYPTSPWADKALLRLAQLDYGAGKYEGTVTKVQRFFSDYPTSNVLPTAALWGARAAFDLQQMQQACDWITRGVRAVGDDVETRNQLLFAKQRCTINPGAEMAPVTPDSLRIKSDTTKPAVKPPTKDTVVRPPPAKTPPAAVKPAASPWRVQVAAIADKSVIARLIKKIEAAGFTAYTVPGPRGLTKVQAGPFATRAQAVAGLPKVKAAVGGSAFVTQAP